MSFPVQGLGRTTIEALADARENVKLYTAGDDRRWIEDYQDYQVWTPLKKKAEPQVVCTLWLEMIVGPA